MIKQTPSNSWSLVGLFLGFALAVGPSCGALGEKQTTCTTTNCAGCCEPSGACQLNTHREQCGFGGQECYACLGSQACLAGVCSALGSGGGSGGDGGATGDAGHESLDDGGAVIRADAGMPTLCNMTCATCCDANGTCRPGTSTLECGAGGVQCQACSFPSNCSAGQCKTPPGFDAGSGGFDAGSGGDGGAGGGIDGGRADAGSADGGNTGGGSGGGTGGGSGGGAGGGGGSESMPGDTCATAITLLPSQTQFIDATTAAKAKGDYSGDCGSSGGFGPDMVFTFTLTSAKQVRVYGAGCVGLNVSIQTPCPNAGSPLLCGASTTTSEGSFEMTSRSPLAAGTYWVVVDTFASQLCGYYIDLVVE